MRLSAFTGVVAAVLLPMIDAHAEASELDPQVGNVYKSSPPSSDGSSGSSQDEATAVGRSSILNLGEVGQSYQIVAQIDCKIGQEKIDMNGAASTVSMGGGPKTISLFFATKWPWQKSSKIGVLALEAQGEETTLGELTYNSETAPPIRSNGPQPPVFLSLGDATFYVLTPRNDPKKWLWDYEEHSVLVHGATQTYKGICELKEGASSND